MSVTMGGDDAESLDFDRLNDLYVVDNLTMGDMDEMPDIFSTDAPPIDDSPEAAAAFDSFVNELDGTMGNAQQQTNAISMSATNPDQIMTANTAISLSVAPQSTSTSYSSSALSSQIAMNADDYPDRLDLRGLSSHHQMPLNVPTATRSVSPYTNGVNLLVPDSNALSAHLTMPLNPPRSWTAAAQATAARLPQHDSILPIAHTTAASRGRPRVREMRHVPERGAVGRNAAPSAAAKLRYSKGAAPSKYCHVCGRSAKTVSVALCGNNKLGLCRKVVCDKCLLMHQRDSWELAKRAGAGWICMHCRNLCPERARCHQYQRNNLKRRMRAAAPTSPNGSVAVNIRRAATGRIGKGVRAGTVARRTAAMAEATSVAICPTNSPENAARGGDEISSAGTEFYISEVAKVPQVHGANTVSDHNPITPAELDEHEKHIRNRNLRQVSHGQYSGHMFLNLNTNKMESHPVSLHSTPARQIIPTVMSDEAMLDREQHELESNHQVISSEQGPSSNGVPSSGHSMNIEGIEAQEGNGNGRESLESPNKTEVDIETAQAIENEEEKQGTTGNIQVNNAVVPAEEEGHEAEAKPSAGWSG